MVKVKNLAPALVRSYGAFQHIPLGKAVKGQMKGYWEIIGDAGSTEPFVSPKSVMEDIHDDKYLVRTEFRKKEASERALTYEDVRGQKNRPY